MDHDPPRDEPDATPDDAERGAHADKTGSAGAGGDDGGRSYDEQPGMGEDEHGAQPSR